MIRVIQRRLIIPRGDTGIFTIPAMTQAEGAIGVFTIFDPITNTRIFQKQVEIEGENFNISFSHADTVNLKAGDYLWDIKFYKNPILADNKVIDGEEINSYYAAFQAPKCEIRETGDDFLMIEGQPAKIEDLNIILGATEAANAAKVAATEQAEIAAAKAEEAAAKLEEMMAAMPTKVSELENDSGYLQEETDPTVPAWAKAQTKPSYTPQEVGALPADTFIPSKVSDLTDDSGHYTKPASGIPASDLEETYLTAHQDISMKANSADLAAVATSGSYNDLEDKPTIPDVQINGNSIIDNGIANIPIAGRSNMGVAKYANEYGLYINNEGYATIYYPFSREIKTGTNVYHPIVPSVQHESTFYGLAKAAGDITQIQSSNAVGTYTDGAKTAIQQMLDVPSTAAIPTKVSQLQNDSGYLTSFTETDPTVPEWAKAAQKPSYTAAEVGAPTIAEMNTAIGNAIGNINSFDMAVVQALPEQDISTHTIYLVPKTGETNDVYDEYVYINNAWEMVGNTQIDLSNYVQKTDYATNSNAGVVTVGTVNDYNGIYISSGRLFVRGATTADIKNPDVSNQRPIVPSKVDDAAFYGLAAAAGDSTQSASSNAVGTYTTEAKAAIRSMIGAAASADVTVQDVQINGTSVVENGVANIPISNNAAFGVAKTVNTKGIYTDSDGYLTLTQPTELSLKLGNNAKYAISTVAQHKAVFYGLARAAGDSTQSQSDNAVGTYTAEAKAAIQTMLDVPAKGDIPEVPVQDVQVNGTSVTANGVANVPMASANTLGAVKVGSIYGIQILNDGEIRTNPATDSNIKLSNASNAPIVPQKQHMSVFYGLAKAAGDTTQSASSNAVGVYTNNAKAAIKNMLGITQTLTVTVLTQDNVTVTGQTVTIRAVDSTGPIFATAAYEGQPVAFAMPSGFAYHVSVSDTLDHHFNPTTASGVITNTDVSVTLQYSDFSTIRTAADIKAALNANLNLTDLVGEQITCTKNGETLAWDVVDYDSTTGRIKLLLHDAFGTTNMVFEPAQALMWCENGLAAGSYTFTWNTTQCYFTLTTAIPVGGQLRATNSQFQTYASQSATATLETGTVGTEEITGATDLGHDGQGLLNHRDRVNYGSNNIAESAIQWWLNSDVAANTLRTPVTKFSRAYSYAQPGFMNGLDPDFVNCLDEVDWLCSTNNVYECPESLGGYTKGIKQAYTVKAKFALASEMEIFGSYGGNPDGSTIFDLYNGAEADDRKKYRGTSAQTWRLRSPFWGNAYHERHVRSSGSASHDTAHNSYAVVPACQISRDSEVTE